MANQFTKAKIDFDVYQKADPESLIDFGAEAKKISDAFGNVAEERGKKKAALEKAFQDQQAALNDLGEYDNPTAQQVVMNAGQDGANKLLDMKNMMKRGLVKPADVTMFQQNQLNGFNLLKKNMGNFDKTFQEYTTRLQENMEGSDLSKGAPAEQWLAKQLEGFANMNNVSVQTDPETGNVSMLRLNEDGTVDKNSSATLNRLTLLMKQKVNNFDPNAGLKRSKEITGTVIDEIATEKYGPNVQIDSETRSRLETEYYQSENGQTYLNSEAQSLLADPYDMQSCMLNSSLTNEDGTAIEIGDQKQFDEWNAENEGNEKNNPYLVMEFGADNQYNAQFTDAQKEIALDAMKTKITGSLDYKKEVDVKALNEKDQPRAKSSAEIGLDKDNKEKSSRLGDYEIALNDEDPKKRKDMTDKLLKKRNDEIRESNKGKSDEEKTVLIDDIRVVQKEVDDGEGGTKTVDVRVVFLENGDEIPLEGNTGDQMNTLDLLLNPDNNLTSDDIADLAKDRDLDLTREVQSKSDKTRTQKGKTTAINFDNPTMVGGEEYATSDAYLKNVFGDVFDADKYSATADTDAGVAKNWAAYVQAYFPPELMTQFQDSQMPLTSNYIDKGDKLPDGTDADGDKLVMTLGGKELIIDISKPTTNQQEIEAWMLEIQAEEDERRTTTGGGGGGSSR